MTTSEPLAASFRWKSGYICASVILERSGAKVSNPYFAKAGNDKSFIVLERAYVGEVVSAKGHVFNSSGFAQPPKGAQAVYVDVFNFRSYRVAMVVIRLSDELRDNLVSIATNRGDNFKALVDLNKIINELIRSSTMHIEGVLLDDGDDFHALEHVIFLEPDVPLLSDRANTTAMQAAAWSVHRTFTSASKTGMPSNLFDMMILPGVGHGNRGSPLMVRVEPYFKTDSAADINLPLLVEDYLNYSAKRKMQNLFLGKLSKLQMSNERFWELPSEISNLETYRSRYLSERLTVQNAIVETEEMLEYVERRFPVLALLSDNYKEFPDAFSLSDLAKAHIHSLSFIVKHRSAYADESIKSQIKLLKRRLSYLADNLPAIAEAQIARVNIQLNRRVLILTVILTLVGIASLVVGVLPDGYKQSLLEELMLFVHFKI